MSYETSTARWVAVSTRDKAADGLFVYAVKSTGIYCRPTCAARLARRANVDFYRTPAEAQAAGFRPCKRCKPEAIEREDPQEETVKRACDVIARVAREGGVKGESSRMGAQGREGKGLGLKELAEQVGKTPRYLHKIFKDRMGVTPKQYAEQMREMYYPSTTSSGTAVTAAGSGALTGIPTAMTTGMATGMTSGMASGITTPFDFDNFEFGVDLELSPEFELELAREFERSGSDRMSDGGGMSPEGSLGLPLTPANTQFENFPPMLNGESHDKPTAHLTPQELEEFSITQDVDEFLRLVRPLKELDWVVFDEFGNFGVRSI
ncbi:hypothetical protein NA57DRAFT_55640 [Rhizodiscina lignyota]|uniref:HTH araC/xylS-type domain-containing protein n=1 Tax=Rhizodiscina lignyota TaxID=1504668 RepID=A0A9P4II57_9PEZI|nr:hypothetical protein NA57DRAFT_55640 [Rhizodiscina lignyota]